MSAAGETAGAGKQLFLAAASPSAAPQAASHEMDWSGGTNVVSKDRIGQPHGLP